MTTYTSLEMGCETINEHKCTIKDKYLFCAGAAMLKPRRRCFPEMKTVNKHKEKLNDNNMCVKCLFNMKNSHIFHLCTLYFWENQNNHCKLLCCVHCIL